MNIMPILFFLSILALNCGEGKQTPHTLSFKLQDLNGSERTMGSFGKKLILVDFWTTWCPPCRESIPHLNTVYSRYKDRLDLVGISLDTIDKSQVAEFARKAGISYPILMGNTDLAQKYGIRSIPTILFVDRNGIILQRHTGIAGTGTLEGIIRELLKKV